MSEAVPWTPELGALELDEVFFEYEVPRIFTARTPSGSRYFAVCVDEEEAAQHDTVTYLYAAVSERRWQALRSGAVGARRVFLEPEDGRVAEVIVEYGDGAPRGKVVWLAPGSIPQDWLPTEDAQLRLPTDTLQAFSPERMAREARQMTRSVLALRLSPPGLRSEYPVRPLAQILQYTQEVVEALVDQQTRPEPSARGPLPQRAIEDAELALYDVQAASFVAMLSPSLVDRLMEDPVTSEALADLVALLEWCNEPDDLGERIAELGPRVIGKLRELLEEVVDGKSDFTTYYATSTGRLSSTRLESMLCNGPLTFLPRPTQHTPLKFFTVQCWLA